MADLTGTSTNPDASGKPLPSFGEWEVIAFYAPGVKEMEANGIGCRKGDRPGENQNLYYCGTYPGSVSSGEYPRLYLRRIELAPDGAIGETVRREFNLIYDGQQQYLRTECGRYVDDRGSVVNS